MTPASRSAAEILEGVRATLGSVPAVGNVFVCKLCLGPVSGDFTHCYGCHALEQVGPRQLSGAVVPMTSAINPSPWYSRLVAYKTVGGESMLVLAALTSIYVDAHQARLKRMLDGEPTLITVVPSTRGRTHEQHPLPRTLKLAKALRDRVAQTLRFLPGSTIARREYKPEVFRAAGHSARGERILLVEDTWVTGSKALSAAGALLRDGAASVVVLPIAREIRPNFWGEDHPYLSALRTPYDPGFWPR